MKLEYYLDSSDRERVAGTLGRTADRTNRKLSLSELVDEWRNFVVVIGQGYNWSLDMYYRDLGVRDLIEEVSESLSISGRRTVNEAVKQIDEDFIRLTWDPTQPEYSGRHGLEIGWWQFRVPLNPGDMLRSDLAKMDYIYSDVKNEKVGGKQTGLNGIANLDGPELIQDLEMA
jgi:hypothetical protein